MKIEKKIDSLIDKADEGRGAKGFREFQPTVKDTVQDAVYLDYIGYKLPAQQITGGTSKRKIRHFYRPEEMIPGKEASKDLDEVIQQDYSPKDCRFCKQLQAAKRLAYKYKQPGDTDKAHGFFDPETSQYINTKRISVNSMNVPLLAKFLNQHGKILTRKQTGNCHTHQKVVAHAVKKAQHMGFFTFKHSQFKIHAPYLPENMINFTGPNAALKDASLDSTSLDFTPEYKYQSEADSEVLDSKPDTRRQKRPNPKYVRKQEEQKELEKSQSDQQ